MGNIIHSALHSNHIYSLMEPFTFETNSCLQLQDERPQYLPEDD